jgi:hypothetical protein
MRALLHDADLDDAGLNRWLNQLEAWGYLQRREGKRGPEFGLTTKGLEWVEAGLPELPQEWRTRVAVETVMEDNREAAEFFASHKPDSRRDEIAVVATWFFMREKETFTPADVVTALTAIGRDMPTTMVHIALSAMSVSGEVRRLAQGLYEITPVGIDRARRVFAAAKAQKPDPAASSADSPAA